MPLSTWNSNLSAYENVKSNVLADKMAKNRWGSKFKKLYNPLKDVDNKVDFTQGMHNCAGTDVLGIIQELEDLRDALNSFFLLSDNSTAKPNSYFTLLGSLHYGMDAVHLDDVQLSLSTPTAFTEDDQRRISKFFRKNNTSSSASSFLEPIDSYFLRKEIVQNDSYQKPFYSKNQLSLWVKDGTQYGHIEENYILDSSSNFSNVHSLYGIEEENELFKNSFDYSKDFLKLFSDFKLEKWLLNFMEISSSWAENINSIGDSVSIVFGADLVLAWINENLTSWYAYLNDLDQSRVGKELELIEHLNLCEMLKEEIGNNAGKISSIWFQFKKEVTPNIILVKNSLGNKVQVYDPAYKWWEEEHFDEVRKKFKNFHTYFKLEEENVDDGYGGTGTAYVVLKDESALELSGWKIYWLVTAFLDIGSRAKKQSLLKKLFSIALLVVGIYLTAVSGNPAWVKIILVAVSIANFSGSLSPKAQLVLASVMFVYGISNTSFSTMSTSQIFSWTINNIEMVFKMVQMYKFIKLEDETKEEDLNPHETQEQSMHFIYSDAYNQYDNLYAVMYDYEPKYK
ncbi:MAG: Unknown protein [uncultured Sulfurovum sp.]|uniref:Uncharacterized protein n=1 Tax=uncultured Sulfurovum sp. TaxID=269237 RepID=A0A6S6SNQ1_9BACT|nr:MAG: Unknown protein [uncultured Sulfurovum sp.]